MPDKMLSYSVSMPFNYDGVFLADQRLLKLPYVFPQRKKMLFSLQVEAMVTDCSIIIKPAIDHWYEFLTDPAPDIGDIC